MNKPPLLRSARDHFGDPLQGWRRHLFTIIFESDTRAGRTFDMTLLTLILIGFVLPIDDTAEWTPPA